MFVAINYITCTEGYRERFESLMRTRMGAIDKMEGFQRMKVLRPSDLDQSYLILSEWDSEDAFKAWTKSEAFIKGHRRGFSDLDEAKKRGEEAPMTSEFQTYQVIAT
jgi:heme-degrading monooxygenase HmoA